ncbi:retrovirus-related pol polyprotein from transposon TNT 1-94 [Tanacetum coccineum]
MLAKQNDSVSKEKKIHISLINYSELNKLSKDFGKRFVLQKQLSADEAFYGLHSEINEVKTVFNQMEAVVEQCSVDKKYVMHIVMHADSVPVNVLPANNKCLVHDSLEIERLEQENDHLFELLLSQNIVHICVNSLATRTNCHEMQRSFIDEYNKTLELKAQLAKKEHMIEKTVFNKLALRCLRLENRYAPGFQEFFHINKWQAKLEAKDVSIANLKKHIKNLKGKNVVEKDVPPNNANVITPGMFRPLDNDLDSACKYAKRIQEGLVYVIATCPTLTKPNEKLVSDVNVRSKSKSAKRSKKRKVWKPSGKVFTNVGYRWIPIGRKFTIDGNRFPLTRITSTNVVPPKNPFSTKVTKKTTPRRNNLEMLKDVTNISSSSRSKVVQIVLWYLDSDCSKHMTRNRSQLINFIDKFLGTVRFGNDQIAKIMGYVSVESINGKKYILVIVDDYSWFTWVKFLRSKDEAPNYYEVVEISHETSVPRTPQQNGVVKRQNWTLVEAALTMLIFSKALLFLWEEAVAIACYTQNRSLIRLRHGKTPYELLHDKKPYLTYFHIFGALCYPTNDNEDLGKLKPKADIGLVQKPTSLTPYAPPTKNDWEILFQPLFDEYFNPSPSVVSLVPAVVTPEHADPTGTPSSTSIDQDAPSPRTSQTPQELQSPVIPCGVKEKFHDIEVARLDNDPFFGVPIPEPNSEESSSRDVISTNVHSVNQPLKHLKKWTKDHPFDNIIGNPSRPVSTRHQLQTEAMFCYFDAFLTFVEPKNYKEALKESCWIEAMQEELNEFERLEVWELVPRPDRVMIITLKWIFKVKLDELRGILKNKARHRYAVSSLMDTSYRMSEQYSSDFFILASECVPFS